jgi:cytochrome c oxidase cbb3-type subunit 4
MTDTYSFLRALADSWVLLAMTLFYLGVFAWAFRPGSRKVHDEIARIPLRNDTLHNPPSTGEAE